MDEVLFALGCIALTAALWIVHGAAVSLRQTRRAIEDFYEQELKDLAFDEKLNKAVEEWNEQFPAS